VKILFDGKSISGLGPEAIVRLGISLTCQRAGGYSPAFPSRKTSCSARRTGASASRTCPREADAMFDLFPDIRRPLPMRIGWTLSGGQLQMVAVARGLMAKPRLLPAGRAVAGARPCHRAGGIPDHLGDPAQPPRSCLSSKTRAWASPSPTTVTCWRTGRHRAGLASPTNCGANEAIRAAYLGGHTKVSA